MFAYLKEVVLALKEDSHCPGYLIIIGVFILTQIFEEIILCVLILLAVGYLAGDVLAHLVGQLCQHLCPVFITNYESLKKFFVIKVKNTSRFTLASIEFDERVRLFKSVTMGPNYRAYRLERLAESGLIAKYAPLAVKSVANPS